MEFLKKFQEFLAKKMNLKEKIKANKAGILLYGLTPPSVDLDEDKISQIANLQLKRLENSNFDGLVIYDLQDEKERNSAKRTFAFRDTIEPLKYYNKYLSHTHQAIIYKAVSKYNKADFQKFISQNNEIISIFVGASSKNSIVKINLNEAYDLKAKFAQNLTLGGICIAERHISKGDEDKRVSAKIQKGCEFFISQAVCNIENAKFFLQSYAEICQKQHIKKVPIIFTFTPCGDAKTMSFMRWLGIDIPVYFEQRLLHSSNPLKLSLKTSLDGFDELFCFGKKLGISVGANIESISTKKVEIEASIELLNKISAYLAKNSV